MENQNIKRGRGRPQVYKTEKERKGSSHTIKNKIYVE